MLLSLSIIGIILSLILLFSHARKNASTIYLSLFFLLVSLYGFIQYVLIASKSVFLVSILLLFIPILGSLMYLIGPMIYLYTRSVLTDDPRLKMWDLLHFLPMVIYFILSLPRMFNPWSDNVELANEVVEDVVFLEQYKFTILSQVFSVHAMYLSRPVLVLGYTFCSIILFTRYLSHKKELHIFSRQQFVIKWLFVLLAFQSIIGISYFLNMLHPISVFIALNFFHILSAVGLMGLLISPFFFPEILYGLPQLPQSILTPKPQKEEQKIILDDPNFHAASLESDYILFIDQKATSCMKEIQPYLRPDFNLTQFSVLIHIPAHHLSYYFREEKKQHFNNYRNEWRINHAKNLIRAGKAKEVTLETIGLQSGFANRNAFISTFKKFEGITPSTFATQIKS